jgi:hypothetical protein
MLYRFEDVLQTQDCNIILRHYGETRRWDELSKVVFSGCQVQSGEWRLMGLVRHE